MSEPNNTLENSTADFENQAEYDKITFFYISMPVVILSHFLGALLFSALLYEKINAYNMVVWLSISIVFFLYRFYHYYQFKHETEYNKMRDYKIWIHRFYSDVLVSGILWGSTAILMFPTGDIMNQMIVIIFIFTISFTSMGYIAAKDGLLLLYTLFSFVPLITQLLVLNGQKYTYLGLIVVALMLILVILSRYFGNVVNKSLDNYRSFIEIKHSLDILQERFFSLFERAPVGIFYYNEKLEILDSNACFLELNNCKEKNELIRRPIYNTNNMEILNCYRSVFENKVGIYRGPYTSLTSDRLLYIDLNTVPLLEANGSTIKGGIAIVKDITEEVNAKENMLRNTYYDMLTNIPNRTLFMDRLDAVITNSINEQKFAAVLYIDLDNFKRINETFGHDKGDLVLKEVSKHIQNTIGREDTLARLGGDKFTVLMPDLSQNYEVSLEKTMNLAEKILDTFKIPLKIFGTDCHISASIGINILPSKDDGSYDVLKKAETAMYEAKKSGRNTIVFYKKDMGDSVAEFININSDLHKAIFNEELEIYYQPQIDVQNDNIIGAEALIRWIHPKKGMIPPGKFIPIAEESGYIMELSHWIINRVARDIKRLSESSSGFNLNHISININSIHFLRTDFSKELKSIIEKYNIPAHLIEIEITEGVIIENIDEAAKKMKNLKEYGFKFSMDDFGTGYSSLSYLNKIPFNTLKIDQSFIANMDKNKSDAGLVYSIIDIAKSLDLAVVAEGVKTQKTLEMLQKSTCNAYQGYLAYKPMPFYEFSKLIS